MHHSIIHIGNPTRCNSVSKFYFIFIWSSTCFGWHTAHHQEPKTTVAASGFAYVEGCWTCSCWRLSPETCWATYKCGYNVQLTEPSIVFGYETWKSCWSKYVHHDEENIWVLRWIKFEEVLGNLTDVNITIWHAISCSLVDRYQHLEERNWLYLWGCRSVLLPTDQVTCHNIIEKCDCISLFFFV
jgi:hypothetical protein